MKFHVLLHPSVAQELGRLEVAAQANPGGDAAREYAAFKYALYAVRDGREGEYTSKRLTRDPSAEDLRDCAELKVEVFIEDDDRGRPMGPSHRLIYQEYDPPPKLEDGREVADENSLPFRRVIAFERRGGDPFGVAGERLGRQRGIRERDLVALPDDRRPEVGTGHVVETPHRMPMPQELRPVAEAVRDKDLERLKAMQKDSPPAGAAAPPGKQPGSPARPATPGDLARRPSPGNMAPRRRPPAPVRPQSPER